MSRSTQSKTVINEWPTVISNPFADRMHYWRVQGKRRPMLWGKEIDPLIESPGIAGIRLEVLVEQRQLREGTDVIWDREEKDYRLTLTAVAALLVNCDTLQSWIRFKQLSDLIQSFECIK